MDFLFPTQFEQMCRACMSCEENVLQSLFDYVDDYQSKRIQIYEMLNTTVQNLPKIEIMDALPKNLCTRCVEKLCAFYEFKNCCINSDQYLRKLIVTSIVEGAANKSVDPLESDLSEIADFVKHEIIEKDVKDVVKELIKEEHFNTNDDIDKINTVFTEMEQGKEDEEVENDAIKSRNHEENRTLYCEICKKEFLYKRNLIRHIKRSHKIKSIKSAKKTKKIRKEVAHSDDESNEEDFLSCDICEKSFLYKKNLQRHMERAHNIENFNQNTVEELSKTEVQMCEENVDDEEISAKNQSNVMTESTKNGTSMCDEEQFDLGSSNGATQPTTEIENDVYVNNEEATQADKCDVERYYLCEMCDTEFSYKKNLKRHMKRAHDFDWPKDILMESDAPESHLVKKVKKDNRTWTCEICKTQFLYKRNLRRHMKRTHNEESPIEIKTGIEIAPAVVKIEVKSDTESSAEEWDIPKICIWTCERCQKKFTFKKNLKRHMKHIHNEDLPKEELKVDNDGTGENTSLAGIFKCNECDSVFHKKVYLRKHKYRHKQPGGLRKEKRNCDACGLVCKTLQNLREHYMNAHPERLKTDENQVLESLKLYICHHCNKSFQQSCTLKDHLRVHTKEQPFLCSYCGKAFNSKSNLRQHVLRHETEKRYECPECPKKFPCLSDLASHKQVHKQLKPHICDICGAAFGKPYQLKTHKMYHNGEKRYQCEYCAMRFVCGDHLRRHIRTHTGEKPYKCKYCPRSFSQSNDMIKHLRTHLGENVYQCELCPAAFRLAAELRTHFALHKNDDEDTKKRNKMAWHEAQEQLKRKLESELPTHSRIKEPSTSHVLLNVNEKA